MPLKHDLICIIGSDSKCKKKYHIDTVSLNYPKKGMEVDTYMKDGMIENWDVFEKVGRFL